MAPLIVQLLAFTVSWLAGQSGLVRTDDALLDALRLSCAAMFAFTAVSHFVPRTRRDLVSMVPPELPAPAMLVSVTGVLELAGAIGLLVQPLARSAALALVALLVALFPANVHAARERMQIAGREAMALRYRLPLQLFWIGCLLLVATRV